MGGLAVKLVVSGVLFTTLVVIAFGYRRWALFLVLVSLVFSLDLEPLWGFSTGVAEVIVPFVLVVSIIRRLKARGEATGVAYSAVTLPAILYLLIGLVPIVLRSSDPSLSLRFYDWQFIGPFLLFPLALLNVRTGRDALEIADWIIALGVLQCAISFVQIGLGPGRVAPLVHSVWGQTIYGQYLALGDPNLAVMLPSVAGGLVRATGTFFYANFYAAFLAYPLCLALGRLTSPRRTSRKKLLFYWLAVGMIVANVILSQSRGAWLTLAIVLSVWLVLMSRVHRQRFLLAFAVMIVFAGFWFHGELSWAIPFWSRAHSAFVHTVTEKRVILWEAYTDKIAEAPLLGSGDFGFWHKVPGARASHPHSLYIQTLYQAGAVGLLVLSLFLLSVGRDLKQAWHTAKRGDLQGLVVGLALCFGWFLVQQFFEFSWHHGGLFGLFWLSVGMISSLASGEQPVRAEASESAGLTPRAVVAGTVVAGLGLGVMLPIWGLGGSVSAARIALAAVTILYLSVVPGADKGSLVTSAAREPSVPGEPDDTAQFSLTAR